MVKLLLVQFTFDMMNNHIKAEVILVVYDGALSVGEWVKITEIVRMKTVEGVEKDDFINIVDGLETNFHSRQHGFIDTELLYNNEEDEW